MNILKKKPVIFFLLIITLLIFLRIDYRFKYTIECCSDEYDYFMHASTIVNDFDFDYSNQDLRDFRFTNNNKIAPVGFVGTGILFSPFLYLGNLFNQIFNESIAEDVFNYQIFFYSMSSVIYFFLTYLFIYKTMKLIGYKLNKYKLLLIFSASGLPYYAFERFGMTHIAEVFTISLLIYLLTSFYLDDTDSKITASLISPILLLSFLTRMSNFFIFLIPLIVKKYLQNSKKVERSLAKNYYFLSSVLISAIGYFWILYSIYGKFILNPQKIYNDSRTSSDLFGSFIDLPMTIIDIAASSFNVLFTFEFGIFWMSPILFFGTIYCLLKLKNYKSYENWLLFLCFAQNFVIIYLWQSAASSYGFRYLFSLVPIALFVLFLQKDMNEYVLKYLTIFSIFSLIGIMFFETTVLTQLSVVDEYNSFGRYIRYVEPEYVKGVVLALGDFNSYLIIFSTSFLGALFFKTLLIVFGRTSLESILSRLGLPVENNDFQNYLENLQSIGFEKFIIVLSIFSVFSYFITYKAKD